MLPTGRELHRLAAASGFAVAAMEKVVRLAEWSCPDSVDSLRLSFIRLVVGF